MDKIDFSSFNKPKHFPQWLCSGDTLKLAEYDDAQLEELDKNIRDMSGQFDIDNASGAELDRIGKILGEDRGGNSDRIYRIYLKLRTMLNTADGTVEDIIRFVKFFFTSETVHLVPNYPAGLRILHDGFNDTVDFNRIIRQIVGAGIAYDTRELFNMTEEFPIDESDEKKVHRVEKEHFPRNTILRNGRVLRDGVTVLPTHFVPLFRDGSELRNGAVERRNELHKVKADEEVNTPVLHNSGILDVLALCYRRILSDAWKSHLKRNGAVCRNGSERRSGYAAAFANDRFFFDSMEQSITERIDISDTDEKKAVMNSADGIGRRYKRNGSLVRDGIHHRASDRLVDFTSRFSMLSDAVENWSESDSFVFETVGQKNADSFPVRDESMEGAFESSISDAIGRGYRRNGTILRGRKAYRSSNGITDPHEMHLAESTVSDSWSLSDSFESGKRWWFFRGGQYTRDSSITRKSGVLEAI